MVLQVVLVVNITHHLNRNKNNRSFKITHEQIVKFAPTLIIVTTFSPYVKTLCPIQRPTFFIQSESGL